MKRNKTVLLTVIIVCISAILLSGCSASMKGGSDALGNQDGAYNKLDGNNVGSPAQTIVGESGDKDISQSGDEYGKIIENEFVKTENEPVSTFSADVDTASYAFFRKLVNSGYDLSELKSYAGQSLRTEEMVNYFTYTGNTPEDNDLFGVKTQIAACPWNTEAVLMCLNLSAKKAQPAAGNNLVFLIDVSGSMSSEDKLPLLIKSFSYLTAQLTDKDTVSVVTYSGKEAVVLDGCSGSKAEQIQYAVNSLKASGSTNGEAGLKKAYELAAKNFIEGGNNRIIMASDGDLNVGINSADELKSFVENKRDEGVYLSVLGFGTGNYQDNKMETLADNGNGVYYYIDGLTEAEKVFGTDLTSTLYTVAEDVKLQLTFNSAYVSEYRLVGYENRLLNKEDFTDDTKDAGEVGSGHTVTVCYELKLTETAKNADEQWMKLAVRFKNPGEDVSNLNEYNIGKESFTEAPDSDFSFICAVIETSMLMRNSKKLGDINIGNILDTLISLDLSGDSYKSEFRQLIQKLVK